MKGKGIGKRQDSFSAFKGRLSHVLSYHFLFVVFFFYVFSWAFPLSCVLAWLAWTKRCLFSFCFRLFHHLLETRRRGAITHAFVRAAHILMEEAAVVVYPRQLVGLGEGKGSWKLEMPFGECNILKNKT